MFQSCLKLSMCASCSAFNRTASGLGKAAPVSPLKTSEKLSLRAGSKIPGSETELRTPRPEGAPPTVTEFVIFVQESESILPNWFVPVDRSESYKRWK